jgi:hypothetical protein
MGQKKKISLKFRKISLRARVILVTFVKSNVSLVRFWVPIFLLVKILYMFGGEKFTEKWGGFPQKLTKVLTRSPKTGK